MRRLRRWAISSLRSSRGWNSAKPGIIDVDFTDQPAKTGDGKVTVDFHSAALCNSYTCLAIANPTYRLGKVVDADVYINPRVDFTSVEASDRCDLWVEFYIESVITHEIGHVLQLGHSGSPLATMNATLYSCQTAAVAISADDKLGIRYLYR